MFKKFCRVLLCCLIFLVLFLEPARFVVDLKFKGEMAYVIVEWQESGAVSVINKSWLTPLKREAFWPPCKEQKMFNKIIQQTDPMIDNQWVLHGIKRCMYETDDLEKALGKCKDAENTSNLESEVDLENTKLKKRKLKFKKILSSTDEEDEIVTHEKKRKQISRPPRLDLNLNTSQESSCIASNLSVPSSIFDLNNGSLASPRCHNSTLIQQNGSSSRSNLNTYSQERSCTTNNSSVHTPLGQNSIFNLQHVSDARPKSHNSTLIERNISSSLGTDTDNTVLSLLYQIREQNCQILNHLNYKKDTEVGVLPKNFPVGLPIKEFDELKEVERFLQSEENLSAVVSFLSSVGGKDVTSRTNRILKLLITDHLATFFSFQGKRLKRSFGELLLCDTIIRTVKKVLNVTNSEVEAIIKTWLKHSPQRYMKKTTR